MSLRGDPGYAGEGLVKSWNHLNEVAVEREGLPAQAAAPCDLTPEQEDNGINYFIYRLFNKSKFISVAHSFL